MIAYVSSRRFPIIKKTTTQINNRKKKNGHFKIGSGRLVEKFSTDNVARNLELITI